MKYAVIDISSSSISMSVAEMNARVTEIIFRDRASLTLLHYLDGRDLSQRGIEKLTEAVSVMKDKCVSLGVDAAYDKVFCTRLGSYAGKLAAEGRFGVTVALSGNKITFNALSDIAGRYKLIDPASEMVAAAEGIGICLGR